MTLTSPWRCLACGAEAVLLGPSLDPAHPVGRCLGLHRKGAPSPLSSSLDEVARAMAANVHSSAARRHALHLRSHLVPNRCQLCAGMYDALQARHGSA